jgi:hypothetical protein
MAQAKDPTQITLREAADAYNARGAGKVARFGPKGKLKDYGDMPLIQAFTPDADGIRPIDEMLNSLDSQNAINSLQDDLRRISKDVNRKIFKVDPESPALNLLPGLEADDAQTYRIFGERISATKMSEIAILIDNKSGWKEFMDQLDEIRSRGGNDAVIADAIYVNLQTGYRSGAIAGLKGNEYKVERGTIEITPQTKATPQQEKRAGAQKLGGARGEAVPQDVPLNEQAHARLQQRLAANANDPEIKAFIESQIAAGKPAPIFVIKDVSTDKKGKRKVKFRELKTSEMTDVLAQIKTSTPIIKDNVNNKEFNTLVPDDPEYRGEAKKGKFGAGLLRNVFANAAAYQLEVPEQMIDFLQGRSSKSGAETISKTRKSGYLVRPRGVFVPAERDAVQSVGNWFDTVQGVSVANRFNIQTERVTSTTYPIGGMFDPPPTPVVEPVGSAIKVVETPAEGAISPDLLEKLKQNPVQFKNYLDMLEKKGVDVSEYRKMLPSDKLGPLSKAGKVIKPALGPLGFGLTTAAAVTTGTAVRQRAEAMGIPEPLAKTAGVVAGASEFLPVPPSDVAEVQPDPFSMRPVERAAAESEIVREGLKTTGQLQEVAPRETRKAAPAPIDDSFLTMSP